VIIPEKFAELDRDGSGEVDYEEFCEGFGFADTALTRKLFDAFDYDLSGQISIVEVTPRSPIAPRTGSSILIRQSVGCCE